MKIKAGGVDNISTKVLKELGCFIFCPLTHFNLVLQSGTFPEHFKKSDIAPIYKSGDKSSVFNYRSIALLFNFTKILEIQYTL